MLSEPLPNPPSALGGLYAGVGPKMIHLGGSGAILAVLMPRFKGMWCLGLEGFNGPKMGKMMETYWKNGKYGEDDGKVRQEKVGVDPR